MRTLRWMCGVTKLDKVRNEKITGQRKWMESQRKSREFEVEVVYACDEKKGAIRRKEGDWNRGTREKEMRRPEQRWLDRIKGDRSMRRDCR